MAGIHREPAYSVPEIDYQTRLPVWETDMLESGDHRDYEYRIYAPSPGIEIMAANRELTTDAASPIQITETERRIGLSLPPSYRAFLESTNGLFQANPHFSLLPVAEIRWFAPENQGWIDAYGGLPELDDERYFTYGNKQDPVWIRQHYMQNALQISDVPEEDVALVIPDVRFGDEWEAWMFGNKNPGAHRYRSFAEFFEREVLDRSWH